MNDDDQDGDKTEFLNFTPQPTVVDNYIAINPSTEEQRENLFRSSFAFVDPYLNGPSAVDEPLETGQPAGSRNMGEIGAFVNLFSLNSPYTPGKEYHFFTVEIMAVARGQVGFSGNVAEANKTLVFSLPSGGGSNTEVDPANIGFYQDLNSPLVVRVVDVSPWQNTLPCDVNDDGRVTPLDVLVLISDINLHEGRVLPPPTLDAPPPYLDPNGDDEISASDVLKVVNWINASVSNGGEGEVSEIALPIAVPDRFSLDSASRSKAFALRFPSQMATDQIPVSRLDAARISPASAANAPSARRFTDAAQRGVSATRIRPQGDAFDHLDLVADELEAAISDIPAWPSLPAGELR